MNTANLRSEYRAWVKLRNRCNNPNNTQYKDYGGRGIFVCERWRSFSNFIADMGPKPSPLHSIDRINNNGPYSPENCRWADKKTQVRNTRPRSDLGLSGLYRYPNGKFRVRINIGYRTIYIGTTDDFFEACCLRKSAENRYWSDTSV